MSKTINTEYGAYIVPEELEKEFLKDLSVLKHIDILPSARESHFNQTWGKYKIVPAKTKKK